MPSLEINGGPIHYDSVGEGETLFLIAGTGFSGKTWWPASIDRLSKRYRVITWDLRGTGDSPGMPGPYSTRGFAADAAALLRQLDAAPAHVLGHSMGGRVAQWVALDHPDLVHTLVLACTGPGRFPGNDQPFGVPVGHAVRFVRDGYAGVLMDYLETAWIAPDLVEADRTMVDWVFGRFWSTRPTFEDYLKHTVARQDHQTAELLASIEVPTLVLVGTLDERRGGTNSHLAQAQYLADQIPNAQLLPLDDMAHGVFWQDPDRLDGEIETWLGQHPVPPSADTRMVKTSGSGTR